MIELKFSQIKQICKIIGCRPKELPNYLEDDWEILTDDEANERVKEYIMFSLAYFRPEFLASCTQLPEVCFNGLANTEDHDSVLKIIEATCGLDYFIEQAICADGRGHFISFYDSAEHEISGGLYLYRMN